MSKNKYFHFFGESLPESIITQEEARAIKSLADGTAKDWQQKKAFKVIVEKICKTPHSSFAVDPNMTNFNEGARWVGIMLARILTSDIEKFVDVSPKKTLKDYFSINKK